MKIKLTAPQGYKYKDLRNNREYSTVIINKRDRHNFVLVPDTDSTIMEG